MDSSKVSSLTCSTNSTTTENNHKFITIPIDGSLQQSLCLMTEDQLNYNLLQLNLVSMYNDEILKKLYEWSKQTKFYLKNRYILEKLINCQPKVGSKQKSVQQIVQKYDTVYVNGHMDEKCIKQKQFIRNGIIKQLRAQFISSRQQFSALLDELSINLKTKEKELSAEDLQTYFLTQLGKINGCQIHATISPNKLQLVKQSSLSSQSQSQVEAQQISSQSCDSPKKKDRNIFSICFKGEVHHVKQLPIQNCRFLKTKNRCPLILDFGFGRFLYKNDNQVAHQIIAMHLIRYINRIITLNSNGNEQIIQYQIIPEATGALYQVVENAMTVNDIKKKFKGGISQYLQFLETQTLDNSVIKLSNIRKRFAQTFAGFCISQYLLDLKDRNNSNIMMKSDGSIFHIDLAFVFNATPGGIGFESCPFKFTKEYLDAMGGFQSDCFKYYETLMMSNMTKLCLNRDEFLTKISILGARKEEIACFKKFKIENYRSKIPKKPQHVKQLVQQLISDSYDNWRTKKYDDYQFNTNKILP